MMAARRVYVQKMIGYLLLGIIVVGLVLLALWVMGQNGLDSKFRNLQKLRGDVPAPTQPADMVGGRVATSYASGLHLGACGATVDACGRPVARRV